MWLFQVYREVIDHIVQLVPAEPKSNDPLHFSDQVLPIVLIFRLDFLAVLVLARIRVDPIQQSFSFLQQVIVELFLLEVKVEVVFVLDLLVCQEDGYLSEECSEEDGRLLKVDGVEHLVEGSHQLLWLLWAFTKENVILIASNLRIIFQLRLHIQKIS